MNRRRLSIGTLLAVALIVVVASGCAYLGRTGPLRTESQTVELGGAESVAVNLRMGAGELMVEGGAGTLMEADFTYNVDEWEPIVDYAVSGGQGELTVRQPEVVDLGISNYRYEWDLRFTEDVPIAMTIELGAGRSTLDVNELALTSLSVNVGAGDTTVDLNRDWADDVDVSMRGGVGQATIYLPANVSVRAEVEGGIGQIEATGMSREGDAYVNEAYDGSDATLELDIEGGVGQIILEVVE